LITEIKSLHQGRLRNRLFARKVTIMKLVSNVLKFAAAAGLGLSLVVGFAASADAAMMHKMTKKEMKMAAMHCKEMHGTMMHGKCEMMKKKK
jgi:hypothetical protein